MRRKRSVADARSNLPQVIRDAAAGTAVELTRRGESVAVVLGREQYERLLTGTRSFSEAFDEFARTAGLGELDLDPDEIFGDVRDPHPGRT